MGKINKMAAAASMVAGMGGYGCIAFDADSETELEPHVDDRHIAAIQALSDTVIKSVDAAWDAPTSLSNVSVPEGNCVYVKASKVTITSGSGIAYYGIGEV